MRAYYELKISSYFRSYVNQTRDIGDALTIVRNLYLKTDDRSKIFIEVISQKQYNCVVRVVHDILDNDTAYAFVQNLYLGTHITDNFKIKYKLKFFKDKKPAKE